VPNASERISHYYQSKGRRAFRLRLVVITLCLVILPILFFKSFYFSLLLEDDAMEPNLLKDHTYWFSSIALGFQGPFSKNCPDNRIGGKDSFSRGDFVAVVRPSSNPSSRIGNFFRLPWEILTLGLYRPEAQRLVVRRVLALPGESIVIKNKQIFINGKLFSPSWAIDYGTSYLLPGRVSSRDEVPELYIPAGEYFLLNDHWNVLNDSREFGTVPLYKFQGLKKATP
jgi:signal peptidase I